MFNVSLLVLAHNKWHNVETKFGDTTLHNRLIMNLLQEYELEGRWIFVRMDSVDVIRENWFEVVHPKSIFDYYSDNFRNVTKLFFTSSVYPTLILKEEFSTFPKSAHPIRGIRVDLRRYKILNKLPLTTLLASYFNKDKTLKNKYTKWIYELIAVCYRKNVKVITPSNGMPYYEVFK